MAAREDLPFLDEVRASSSPAAFSRIHFGWSAFPYQEEVMDAVLRHGKKRIAWLAGRRVGKTETTANIVLQLAVQRPGIHIAIFAPTKDQANIMSRGIKRLLTGSRFERHVVVDNLSELRLRFGTDARGKPVESVVFANSMAGSVRGKGADVLIVDESAYCKGADYRSKALPFIAGRKGNIVIHISTMLRDDDHFSDALRDYDRRPDGATFTTPTHKNPMITEEELAGYRAEMRESEYMREYECVLVSDGGVFEPHALAACQQDYPLHDLATLAEAQPKRHHDYWVGVDWAKHRDLAVIAVVEQGTQDRRNPAKLVFLQTYQPRPLSDKHYTRVVDDVLRVAKQFGARVVADAAEGQYQAEVLTKALGGRFTSYRFHAKNRDKLVDKARALVERRGVVLPREPGEVRRAFTNVHETESGYAHASRRSKDVFDAIALALSGVDEPAAPEAREPMQLAPVRGHGSGDVITVSIPPIDPRDIFLPPEWRDYQ